MLLVAALPLNQFACRRVLVRRADGIESVEMIHDDLGLNPRDQNAVLAGVRAQDPTITGASLYSGIKDGQIIDPKAVASSQPKAASKTFQSSIVFSDLGNDEVGHEMKPVRFGYVCLRAV
jgi:hypothetical protein